MNNSGSGESVRLIDVARQFPSFTSLLPFLERPAFGDKGPRDLLRSRELREQLARDVGPEHHALLLIEFVVECERAVRKGGLRRRLPLLAHHVYPAPSNDSTCPVLYLDRNHVDPFSWRMAWGWSSEDPLARGLADLPISGSGQFGAVGFALIAQRIREAPNVAGRKLVCVDLRQEPHCFVDLDHGPAWERDASSLVVPAPWHACCWMTQHDWGVAGMSDKEARSFERLLTGLLRRQTEVKVRWRVESGRGVFFFFDDFSSVWLGQGTPP